jgi:chemotaxis protein MotB
VLVFRFLQWIKKLEKLTHEAPAKKQQFDFKDFKFNLKVREGGAQLSGEDGSSLSGV